MNRGIAASEWRERRSYVLDRDDHKCQDCGKDESEAEQMHIHHKLPYSEGGSHDVENLKALCKSCHFARHAEERRNCTLEDVKDLFRRVDVPILRSKEIKTLLGRRRKSGMSKKLQLLIDEGFLERPSKGVYHTTDIDIERAFLGARGGVIAEGSYIENGEYIGREDDIRLCDGCGRYVMCDKNPDLKLKHHKHGCTGK